MLSFFMNQIVIAIKKENILTYLTLFDNKPESFTAFSETRLRDKFRFATKSEQFDRKC